MMLASIIIVNWNGKKHLHECLDSVFKQSCRDFEVILVDNGSTDDSQYIDTRVELVNNHRNLGFAEANNVGIRHAKGKYIVFLNYDTVVDKDWLKEMLKTMSSGCGACQSQVLIYGTNLVNANGIDVNYLGVSWCGGYKTAPVKGDREIFCASGASMMVDASVLDEVGGFDGDYFMYHDDVDLSWRIKLAGYRIMLSAASKVWHKYEFKRQTRDKFYNLEKNRVTTLLKNYSRRSLLLIAPAFVINELCVYCYAATSGSLMAKLKSNLYILRNIKMIMRKRKDAQKLRQVPDESIIGGMNDSVEFEEISNPLLRNILNPFLRFYFRIVRMFRDDGVDNSDINSS